MNKIAIYLSTAWLISIIIFCGFTFWFFHTKHVQTYKQDEVLKAQYDSLSVEIKVKEKNVKYLEQTIDSVLRHSESQKITIDSLIKYKIGKKTKDEKTYKSISSMSDSAINASLSDKLK